MTENRWDKINTDQDDYEELAMDLIFYVLFAVVILGAIYFIVRGKRT